MNYDFKHVVDFIFRNKDEYYKLSDKDKEINFFQINRKFCRRYPVHAQYFNKKNVDKATATDLWYNFFIKKRIIDIPDWYWFKLSKKKEKSILSSAEKIFLLDFYDISEYDLNFLLKYYTDDVKEDVKKFRKLNKN